MNIGKNEQTYSDNQDRFYIIFIKYFEAILLFSCFLIVIISILDDSGGQHTKRTLHIVIAFVIIGYLFKLFFKKIACKIVIDFNSNTIRFFMCSGNRVKEYAFSSIKSIRLKKYAKFELEEGTIIYNIVGRNEIESVLKKLKDRWNI